MLSSASPSISELSRRLRAGEATSEALVRTSLELIAMKDDALHAFIAVDAERALDEARRADAELAAGLDRGALHGIPVGLKDIIDAAGYPTTCQSKRLAGRVAD